MNRFLNSLKLGQKLYLLFFVGVLIPMFITDWMILHNIIQSSRDTIQNEMEKCANAVEYGLQKHLEYPVTIAHNLYKSQVMEDFLNREYSSAAEYYEAFYRLKSSLLFDSNIGIEGGNLSIYADNPTIINGSGFYRLDTEKDSDWYRAFEEADKQSSLQFVYEPASLTDRSPTRKVVLFMRMDMENFKGCEKILRLELDYEGLAEVMKDLDTVNQNRQILVCKDTTIVLSEKSIEEKDQPFGIRDHIEKGTYRKAIQLYDQSFTINVLPEKGREWYFFSENGRKFLLMLLINIVLPLVMLRMIENSVTRRILSLEKSFDSEMEDELQLITRIEGDDEITSLTRSYNRMAIRMNELIMTVYKDKLHEQEMDIARQNAELLALHSQINPHFLFNALESIRMHSLLRGETETAEMVGKLAVMERTYVNWGGDAVSIGKEMEFVQAYLTLQKYRFGDRLNYEVSVDPDCEQFGIPKLTIVTFVENACIHGIESKSTPGWIFIRAFKQNNKMCIEIEDTGEGLDEEEVTELNNRIKNVTIEDMKNKKHVGTMNAYLRLKKMTKGLVEFELTSEKGVGTMVRIVMPLEIRI
ncbi:MAG: histidine kinase [Lachnospiraceae bacterium]|nr:histidine kinase [Lachnospiraceae bacterium]